MYFIFTTQLKSNWTHFKCSIVTCGEWLLYWTAQMSQQSMAWGDRVAAMQPVVSSDCRESHGRTDLLEMKTGWFSGGILPEL